MFALKSYSQRVIVYIDTKKECAEQQASHQHFHMLITDLMEHGKNACIWSKEFNICMLFCGSGLEKMS